MSTLLVVAHPDDETIGAGIWLYRHRQEGVHVLHTTDGSPQDMHEAQELGIDTREEYALIRRTELGEALKAVEISTSQCYQFRFLDKETYLELPALIEELEGLVKLLQPSCLLSPAYEGGHPDHDAAAFAVASVRERAKTFKHIEFPLYHGDTEGRMITGQFIERFGMEETVTLTDAERDLKHKMLSCFTTQQRILKEFRLQYETFRPAPLYDFSEPPHPGPLLYERWGWGISGDTWRRLAREAQRD